MDSENIKQMLINEFKEPELSEEDLKSTLEHFAEVYHQEQITSK